MINWIASAVWDLVWLVVALAVLRWVVNGLFPGVVPALLQRDKAVAKERTRARSRRARLKEESVYHVSSAEGHTRIVVAKDEEEAEQLGRQSLKAEDVVVAEVYDKAVRK